MGRHEAETSPQQSGRVGAPVVGDDNDDDDDDDDDDDEEEPPVTTVLRISELSSWMVFRTSRARPNDDLRRRWVWKEGDDDDNDEDDEPSAVSFVTSSPPCLLQR